MMYTISANTPVTLANGRTYLSTFGRIMSLLSEGRAHSVSMNADTETVMSAYAVFCTGMRGMLRPSSRITNTRKARTKFLERYSLRMSLIPLTVRFPSTIAWGRAMKLSLANTMSATPRAAPLPLCTATPT